MHSSNMLYVCLSIECLIKSHKELHQGSMSNGPGQIFGYSEWGWKDGGRRRSSGYGRSNEKSIGRAKNYMIRLIYKDKLLLKSNRLKK